MKLGIAYNAACCSELIEYSIDQVRDYAEVITITHQGISNHGARLDARHEQKYIDLFGRGKVDSLYQFNPNLDNNPKQNETHKRNIGMKFCRDKGCDIFLSLDEDEIFDKDQFELALEIFKRGDYDVSVCELDTYYRHPTVKLKTPESYYMSLFVNLSSFDRFLTGYSWPYKVDPSRKGSFSSMKKFSRNEIVMHHFSYVRRDIREKLNNQSASVNWKGRIEEIAKHWDDFEASGNAYFGGAGIRMLETIKCENEFNIEI